MRSQLLTNKIKSNNGGILIIDYGFIDKEMKNTLQSISEHRYTDILSSFGNSDITYNLSFSEIKKIIKQTQTNKLKGKFLKKIGILNRAEILSKNMPFSKKADIYFRVKRLIDEKQMGNLFKVLFVTNKKNKFKLGF